ncbi:(d)CMP kinase [Candidatus Phytoplasma solani]|uniref:Cytidylate kinase n=1 Tax=Candidatus Phytoplasma solani TaxID=69896 RepID=A0A421NXB5_9MOLU|nr:(d)CMP kinase [Candidatus Phytoplasma solani]RMI88677.1 cytidylate kinase [Candidatus Phytoplasma solani]CCP88157.1 Cytidine monophosphate kinase [Candidatus Phytoplasma solani]
MQNFKLAIDGPAGAGKSTVSQKLSQKLGWNHIDTGAMFRALTLYLIENKIPLQNEHLLSQTLDKVHISYVDNKIFLNQQDVSLKIKNSVVEKNVALVATIKTVRDKLLALQKEICKHFPYLIMDGRDIGTVVIPDANLKIFLTANITKRALRNQAEAHKKGKVVEIQEIIEQLKQRDHQDYHRLLSPLSRATDAVLLDTTELSIDEVVLKISSLIQQRSCKEVSNVV